MEWWVLYWENMTWYLKQKYILLCWVTDGVMGNVLGKYDVVSETEVHITLLSD